jgi:L-ascorbate metabolism protein UlaG (beta-lactamase superfamily)
MKITKLGHCCLLIEYKNKRILTDPGAYSSTQNELTDIDLILITHEHPDHLHVESLETVLKNNPRAKIITNTSVGKILSEKGIAFDILEHGDNTSFESILLEAFGTIHEEIYEELGRVENTGYFIDNKLFYPGDAFTNPGKPVDVLALPIVAPWANFKTAIEYALEIKPRIAFPVHDGMLIDGRTGPLFFLSPKILEPKGIKFVPLKEGESFDVE